MKKTILFCLTLLVTLGAFAQEKPKTDNLKKYSTGIDIFSDIWMNTPDEMDPRTINQGMNIFGMYNFPLNEGSNFSLAIGGGLGIHNLYNNSLLSKDENGVSVFTPISSFTNQDNESLDYKRNKLTLVYADLPIELRFRNEKKFRFALGVKVGYLLSSHTKYIGDDYLSGNSSDIRVKFHDIDNLNNMRYGATVKVGYRWANLMAFYSLSELFENNKGPEMYPLSVGITLTPW